MTAAAAIPRAVPSLPGPGRLVVTVARCWRAARDLGAPVQVQQRLHAMLAPLHCDMLAPVFDSLMTLCEATLGRKIAVGGAALSEDERLLLGLLDGSESRRAGIDCATGAASALDCAVRSTRLMLGLAFPGLIPPPPPSGREGG